MCFPACLPSFLGSVIEQSELGASAAIFAAGYTIDSLMFRYQVGSLAALQHTLLSKTSPGLCIESELLRSSGCVMWVGQG